MSNMLAFSLSAFDHEVVIPKNCIPASVKIIAASDKSTDELLISDGPLTESHLACFHLVPGTSYVCNTSIMFDVLSGKVTLKSHKVTNPQNYQERAGILNDVVLRSKSAVVSDVVINYKFEVSY